MLNKLMQYRAVKMYDKKVFPYVVGNIILDFGAGTGLFAKHAIKKGYKVVCVEANIDKINKLEKHKIETFENIVDISLERKFDTTVSFNVIEHIPLNIVNDVFDDIKIMTLNRIIIICPNGKTKYKEHWMNNSKIMNPLDTHKKLYTIEDLEKLMKPFKLVHHENLNNKLINKLLEPILKEYDDILLAVFER